MTMQKLGTFCRNGRSLTSQDGNARWTPFSGCSRRVDQLVVRVHGVAGIGKSSLLEAFARRTRAPGDSRRPDRLPDGLRASRPHDVDAPQLSCSGRLGPSRWTRRRWGVSVMRFLSGPSRRERSQSLLTAWRSVSGSSTRGSGKSTSRRCRCECASGNRGSSATRRRRRGGRRRGWHGLFRSRAARPATGSRTRSRYSLCPASRLDVARRINDHRPWLPLALEHGQHRSLLLGIRTPSIERHSLRQVSTSCRARTRRRPGSPVRQHALEATAWVAPVHRAAASRAHPRIAPRDRAWNAWARCHSSTGARRVVHPSMR